MIKLRINYVFLFCLAILFCIGGYDMGAQDILHPDEYSDTTLVNGIDFFQGSMYTDNGGSTGNYDGSMGTLSLCAGSGNVISVGFSFFNLTNTNSLTILGDINNNNGEYLNMNIPPLLTSEESGCLNFSFYANGGSRAEGVGWIAEIIQGARVPPVPTLSQWGLIILGISIVLMSVLFLRKDSKDAMLATNKE